MVGMGGYPSCGIYLTTRNVALKGGERKENNETCGHLGERDFPKGQRPDDKTNRKKDVLGNERGRGGEYLHGTKKDMW